VCEPRQEGLHVFFFEERATGQFKLFLKVEEEVQINQGEIGARAAEERASAVEARIRTDTPYAELSDA